MSGTLVERLTQADQCVVDQLNRLLAQLSPRAPQLSVQRAIELASAPSVHVFLAQVEGAVAGMLTLIVAPIPTGFHGYIEDVVVDADYRGQGIAESLVRAALDAAREAGAEKVDLTSNPAREAANRLYARLGFQRRDTNVYRFMLR